MAFPTEFSKSDDLLWLQSLFDKYPALSPLNHFVRVRLIVDANAVFEAILWSLKKAKKENARPALLELLEAQAIVCLAPTFLRDEIVSNIHRCAERDGYSIDRALDIWGRYESQIQFHDVGGPEQSTESGRDPKDEPYLRLQGIQDVPIVSADHDIANMGGYSVQSSIFITLRRYSRESATVLKLNVLGVFSAAVPAAVLLEAVKLVQCAMSSALRKVSGHVWIAAACLVALLMLDSKNREWLASRLASGSASFMNAASRLIAELQPAIEAHQRAREASKDALDKVLAKTVV